MQCLKGKQENGAHKPKMTTVGTVTGALLANLTQVEYSSALQWHLQTTAASGESMWTQGCPQVSENAENSELLHFL